MKLYLKISSIGFILLIFISACDRKTANEVVVYVSEDQVFSEPILKDFEKETGTKVKAVYDTEEAKGTGVMNRLIAEKSNPQADIYWANEPIRAEVLKQEGIAASYISPNAKDIPDAFKNPEGFWTGFSARARVLIINTRVKNMPSSIMAYTDLQWKGRAVIANPLFGTTSVEIAALATIRGDESTKKFMEDMKDNKVKISTSNGESADLVASGESDFGLVDSDDAVNRIKQGKSVEMVYPDQEENGIGCLILPNAIVFIKGAPHPQNAKKLVDYLLSRETEKKLAYADCAQIPLHQGIETPAYVLKIEKIKTMRIDYAQVAGKLREIQPLLKEWMGY